jgi:hypothetical protein
MKIESPVSGIKTNLIKLLQIFQLGAVSVANNARYNYFI